MTVQDSGPAMLDNIIHQLQTLCNQEIAGGILADEGGGDSRDGGITNAQLGAIHEFGVSIPVTPKMRAYLHHLGMHLSPTKTMINIPSRPFMRGTVDAVKDTIAELFSSGVANILDTTLDADKVLHRVGLYLADQIRMTIRADDRPAPPLADITVQIKTNKGSPSPARPLVDTGGLLHSVSYDIRPAGATK